MKTLSVNLDVISPLAVRLDHAASRTVSSEYIPGNTLLGSLATLHRVLRPEKTKEFERFFLHGEVLYSNLYASTPKSREIEWIAQGPVYPIPKTAESCKRHKGFLPAKDEDSDGHGVRDNLVDWAVFKLGEAYSSHDRLKALQDHKRCKFSGCGEPMHHFGSYYRHTTINAEKLVQTKNSSRLQTHTGIDRESGTVREGILYNREVFEEGSKFWGEICLPDDRKLTESFTSFLQTANDSNLLRLGTGRTRGMGKVKLAFKPADQANDSYENFANRVRKLDGLIHKRLMDTMGKDVAEKFENVFFFTLTLHSPVILADEFLRYRSRIDVEVLYELFDIAYDKENEQTNVYNLGSVYSNFSNRRITGWQELWGTPRTNEYAIETGSVFLFQCDKGRSNDVLDTLFNLEEQGIGNRRAEGFGRVCVSDPFHLRSEQK